MAETTSVRCYIDAYKGEGGRQGLRLREKGTGRKVSFGEVEPAQAEAFIQSLIMGASSAEAMPDLMRENGEDDAVRVSGNVDFDSHEELRFQYDADLQYLCV
ncbi:hypothetical protein [Curtobacterium sp. PhB78]|uniref:hypothetical protein n=1 Tax=Curtobacterium sp. PhB78 TaxID=2485102 RepID=UPI000F469869|nr:hypothetical protein [Curtobacterium sp. PhB78]ROS46195.1 hypothetical protein EDF53_1014 [Curtobacterium sp. PhB78]